MIPDTFDIDTGISISDTSVIGYQYNISIEFGSIEYQSIFSDTINDTHLKYHTLISDTISDTL